MRKIIVFIVFFSLCFNGLAQNKDTVNVALYKPGVGKAFDLYPGTYSWRGTSTFFDMTSWDSSPYTEGHLKEKSGLNWVFRQNYRLLYPNAQADKSGWDPNYKPGYPLIVMLHGGGERGNCWNGDCYCGTGNGCDPNLTPIPGTIPQFLNNDHVLTHGGSPHLAAVRLAGTKKPGDPTLDPRAFPGFVLFPQNVNAWGNPNSNSSDLSYAIRIIRLLSKQLNIDQDRIYIHGLSLGAQGVYKALNMADWLFAGAAPMSAIVYTNELEYDSVANIPLWAFQGGMDGNPLPSQTEALIRKFREAGGIAKYTLYPNLGHGTWNTAYNEPDFFTWLLAQSKANIHSYYGDPNICGITGEGAKLGLAQGFLAYQWERDGQIIPGAISYLYSATIPGIYRARYSRKSSNPIEADWNRWSDPVTVSERIPTQAVLKQTGTVLATDLNNETKIFLSGDKGFANYYWYKNGTLFKTDTTNNLTLTATGVCGSPANCNNGVWTLITSGFNKCQSPESKAKYLFFNSTAPTTITKPTNFAGRVISPSSVLLTWSNNTNSERGFEIWRKRLISGTTFTTWEMAVLTDEDIVQFLDVNLIPNSTYYYKIRAVSNTARSTYSPNNDKTLPAQNLVIVTGSDITPPTPPQNLIAKATGIQTVTLTWNASIDAGGISQYYIYYSPTDSIATGSASTSYVLTSSILSLNTNYNFTVKAVDFANNFSSNSNQSSANTYVTGLFYEHSTGVWLNTSAVPDIRLISWANPEFTGTVPNFTLAPRTQDDFFNFRFDGFLNITTAGDYRFRVVSNDAMQLYIDGVLRLSDNLGSTTTDATSTTTTANNALSYINLSVGAHSIRVNFMEYAGTQTLTVSYSKVSAPGSFGFTVIPDIVLRSGTFVPPTAPIAPINLTATGASMTQIDLAWQFTGTPPAEYEVYRSTSSGGTYSMVKRVATTTFSDINLLPGTTYYYKLKTVNANGTSPFSSIANAATQIDAVPPTQPTGLAVLTSTFTNASLVWNASTDNVAVTGYEIYANSILIGTTAIPGFLATNLTPNTFYTFTIKAYDASGNKSILSAGATTTTTNPVIYYSKNAGNLNQTASWGLNADGTGTAPDFTLNGQYYTVSNRTTSSLGGTWNVDGTISKVIVPSNVTLTVDNLFIARVEVQGNGALNLNYATVPQLVSISPTSTITYNTASFVTQSTYGNLVLNGTGYKTFPSGITTVLGNLNTSAGVAVKGAGGNSSTISLNGNLTVAGVPGVTPSDFGVLLELTKNGIQTISAGGDLDFYKIASLNASSVINIINGGTKFKLNLGSLKGGGLSLANGSTLNLDNNGLSLSRAGTINSANETGKIAINKGDISISSSSSLNSNLYFDAIYDSINYLAIDLIGSGDVIIKSQMAVTDAIKVKNGELNSGGFIKLISNNTKTTNIQEIENAGIITGDVIVQRYLNAKGSRVYRYISSSVEGITVADWQSFFPITGVFLGASTGTGLSSNPSLYYYDEPIGWTAYPTTNNTAPIEKGRGYAAFIRNATTATLLQTVGNPYQGSFSFSLDGATSTADGWNLLGNPYASTIAWSNNTSGWTKSNISSTVNVRNNPSGQFMFYDADTGLGDLSTGKIAPGQAFWVQAITGGTPGLTITEKAKSIEQQVIYRDANPDDVSHLRIALKQGTLEDAAFVAFTPNGEDKFQNELDAVKKKNEGMFNLSLMAESVSLAISKVSDSFCTKTVWLNVENVKAGQYSLLANEFETLVGINDIILNDNFTHQSINLRQTGTLSFTVTSDINSFGSNRFSISFTRPEVNSALAVSNNNICGDSDAQITIANSQSGVMYTAVNESGTAVSSSATGNGGEINLIVPYSILSKGNNPIQVKAGFNGCSESLLSTLLQVNYTEAPEVITEHDYVSVCSGAKTVLHVSGAPDGGSYKWFKNGTEVTWNTSDVLETSEIREELYYSVSAVKANGCEGDQKIIVITPESLEVPQIDFISDTLYVNTNSFIQWKKDGQDIESAISFSYKPVESGIYTVTASRGDCTLESLPFEFVITGIENGGHLDSNVSVYPNPTSSSSIKIKVLTRDVTPVEINIVNIVGVSVFQNQFDYQTANDGIAILIKEELPNGLYFVIIQQGKNEAKKKLIIKN